MTALKKQALEILQEMPEDKMSHVIEILNRFNSIFNDKITATPINTWQELKKYKGIIPYDINESEELAKAREEKYANFI